VNEKKAIHRLVTSKMGDSSIANTYQPVHGSTPGTTKRGPYVSRPPTPPMSSDIARQRATIMMARARAPKLPSKSTPKVNVRQLFGTEAQSRFETVIVSRPTGYAEEHRRVAPTGGWVQAGEGRKTSKLIGILPSMEKRLSSRARYEVRKGMEEYGGTFKAGPTYGELYGHHVTETRAPGKEPGSRLGRTPGSNLTVIRAPIPKAAIGPYQKGAKLGIHYQLQFGGNLKRSIEMEGPTYEDGWIHGAVGTPVLYAKPLEFGSRHNRPYTFLRPALHQHRKKLQQYVGSQVRQELKG
jgi:hypothetical protein